MKKKILIFSFILSLTIGTSFAMDRLYVTPEAYKGIQKYKQGNYAGCLQDMQKAVKDMKDTSLAYYYMGNSYAKLGRKDDAINSYNQVVELATSPGLVGLSKSAVECLSDTEKCASKDDINSFIYSNKFMHPTVVKKIEEQQVEQAMTEINASKGGKDDYIDFNKYKYLNDAGQNMPTDKEIANAVKVLARVGYNPYANIANQNFDKENAQLNAILGQLGNNQNNGKDYTNMLPYLMAQNQNGQRGADNAQLMQAMMLNQMTGF